MSAPQTQTFDQIVTSIATAVQGAATALVDFTTGSISLAWAQAIAGVTLWLQGLALTILALCRFATSTGPDADSWGADFGYKREGAVEATGPVTLARFTPTAAAIIPAGTIVQTQDGTEQYQLVADTSQSAWSASQNAYVIPAGTASITATAQALVAGSAANVAAGMINTLASAVSGVDTVTNAAAFTTGLDAQSDTAYKAGFPAYLQSLSKGTEEAIVNAATSVQQGVTATYTQNLAYNGAAQDGYFYLVVNDGSGNPPDTLLTAVSNAVQAVRPAGTEFGIFPPTILDAAIVLTVDVAAGYSHAAVAAQVQAAITAFGNGLPVGGTLPYTMLPTIAYNTSPGVINVTGVTLNSGTADLVATNQQVIQVSTVSVN